MLLHQLQLPLQLQQMLLLQLLPPLQLQLLLLLLVLLLLLLLGMSRCLNSVVDKDIQDRVLVWHMQVVSISISSGVAAHLSLTQHWRM
jgi:hypothetical protein